MADEEKETDEAGGDIPIDPETGLPMTKSKLKKLAKAKNAKPKLSKEDKEKMVSIYILGYIMG